jgi:hypothetical protein
MKKLFLSFLLFISCQILSFAQIEGFNKTGVVDFSGGQNSRDYADQLKPNEGTEVINGNINIKGQILTRQGQSLFNVDTISSAFTGLGRFDPNATTSYLLAASGVSVVRSLPSDTSWTIINSGSNQTTGKNTEFVQANNLIFVMNGQDNMAWYDGSTWTRGGTYPGSTSPPTVKTATWLNNYLFAAGNSANPDWVYVSDNLVPQSFSAIQVIKVQSGDGQPIQRIIPYRTGDLMIYKTRSIYDLNIANINSSCTPQPICQWSYTALSNDTGTPAPRSVVSLGNDQWFLSSVPYAVRSMIRTQFDKTFVNMMSQPIQDIFDGTGDRILNTVQVAKAAAVYFDNKYLLAIPTGSSTVNDLVVVYDFITQTWYEIDGWYPAEWLVYQNNLYYIDANDGRVVQCFTGNVGDIGTVIPSTSIPTVGIPFSYSSRIFDFDNPENFKVLDSIGLEFFPTGNYNATLSVNMDNSGWQNVGSIALTANAVTLPVNLPFTLRNPGITYKTIQLTSLSQFKKIQVKITCQGVNQQVQLQKIKIFARILPWRRE